jgi:hypothetical protein
MIRWCSLVRRKEKESEKESYNMMIVDVYRISGVVPFFDITPGY